MIEGSALVQVFATVLAGVLIFLTLERRFGWEPGKQAVERINRIKKEIYDQNMKVTYLSADRERLIQDREANA